MLIEMKTLSATAERTLHPGQRARVPDAEGRELVDGGWAVEIDQRTGQPVPHADGPRWPGDGQTRPRRGRRAAAKKPAKAEEPGGDEPLTEQELAAARELGLPVDDPDNPPSPAWVRAELAEDHQDA